MGGLECVDTMLKDGHWDACHGYHMGNTAENVDTKYQIAREQQDAFALASQQKASAAQKSGGFRDENAPVTIKTRKGDVQVVDDEYIRHDSTAEGMARLRPAFTKDGTVTAGNASGINDGAAALIVMSASEASRRGLTPLARIAGFATAGVDPAVMGIGPVPAAKSALARAGLALDDMDLVEVNEAFAAQTCAVERELDLHDPRLASLPRVLALSKSDLVDAATRGRARARWSGQLGPEVPVIVTSSVTGEGLRELSTELLRQVPVERTDETGPLELTRSPEELEEHRVFRPAADRGWHVERVGDRSFRVSGRGVERLVARYDLENEDALAYLERRLRGIGVIDALEGEGFEAGDEVEIAGVAFDLDPER